MVSSSFAVYVPADTKLSQERRGTKKEERDWFSMMRGWSRMNCTIEHVRVASAVTIVYTRGKSMDVSCEPRSENRIYTSHDGTH